eukprot:gene6783-7548_t
MAAKVRKRRLKIFNDDIEVVSASSNNTIMKLSRISSCIVDGSGRAGLSAGDCDPSLIDLGDGLPVDDEEAESSRTNENLSSPNILLCNHNQKQNGGGKTKYQVALENSCQQWTSIRESMVDAAISMAGMPIGQVSKEFCPFLELPIPVLDFPSGINHNQFCVKSTRMVTVVDGYGRQHLANIRLCSCAADPVVFGKDLYSGLKGATFAEYRFFREQLRTLKPLCSVLSAGNVCPACPKNEGSIFLSMDACFGLVRKKSASKHILPSRHSDLFFLDQENVDHFVDSYQLTKSVNKDCSKFNAGSATSEILNRNKLFDIKAVFGSVCRHEFPNKFMNLKHGERIAYPVLLIKEKLEECAEKPRLQLHFTYDIACMLKKHLMSSKQDSILGKINLGLPAFHTYAHRPSCQVQFGSKYCRGNGLADGEQCERLWSYLRFFSTITKEMRAADRQDLLTDALLYYGRKTAKKLLNTIEDGFIIVKKWVQEQKNHALPEQDVMNDQTISWQKEYVSMILSNRQLRQILMMENVSEGEVVQNVACLKKSEKDLKVFEKKHRVQKRWELGLHSMKPILVEIVNEERENIIKSIRSVAFERTFLLNLKRKHAAGQKLAKSLSKAINQKVASIEKLLKPYNRKIVYIAKYVPSLRNMKIDQIEAFNIDSEIYRNSAMPNTMEPGDSVPTCLKVKAVDLYLTWQRSSEELDILQNDAQNLLDFMVCKRENLIHAAKSYEEETRYHVGAKALLTEELSVTTIALADALSLLERPNFFQDNLKLNIDEIREIVRSTNATNGGEDTNLQSSLNEIDELVDDTDDDMSSESGDFVEENDFDLFEY